MLIYVNITDRQTHKKYSSETHKIKSKLKKLKLIKKKQKKKKKKVKSNWGDVIIKVTILINHYDKNKLANLNYF